MNTLEKKLGVDLDSAVAEAHPLFFQLMHEFDKISASKSVSKKDILRALKSGFNAGLTDVEVNLRSDQEVWMSKIINEMIKCSIIMHAKILKDKEDTLQSSNELESSLEIGTKGE